MSTSLIKIPGTTYYLQFGIEGKYYAVFLIQGRQPIQSAKLNILRGTSLHDLPAEVENGLRTMLEAEEVYISPVVVDRVVNDMLEQVPQEGQMEVKEPVGTTERLVSDSVSVRSRIAQSDSRAGKKSIIEHHPGQKSKFDATADSIGHIELKKPKPLPRKDIMVEQSEPIVIKKEVSIAKPQAEISKTESYISVDDKVANLTNEVTQLVEKVTKNDKEIKKLKRQITALKKATKNTKAE